MDENSLVEQVFKEAMQIPFDSKDVYLFNKQLENLIEKYKGEKIESSKT